MALAIKEMQIKTPLRFPHNVVRIAIIKQTDRKGDKNASEYVGVEQWIPLYTGMEI